MARRRLSLLKQVARNVRDDLKRAKKIKLSWRHILGWILLSIPAAIVFDHFSRLTLFLPIFNGVAALAFLVILKKSNFVYRWFWVTVTGLLAVHIVLLRWVAWPMRWIPAATWAAGASIDLVLMLGVVDFVEKLVNSNELHRSKTPQQSID